MIQQDEGEEASKTSFVSSIQSIQLWTSSPSSSVRPLFHFEWGPSVNFLSLSLCLSRLRILSLFPSMNIEWGARRKAKPFCFTTPSDDDDERIFVHSDTERVAQHDSSSLSFNLLSCDPSSLSPPSLLTDRVLIIILVQVSRGLMMSPCQRGSLISSPYWWNLHHPFFRWYTIRITFTITHTCAPFQTRFYSHSVASLPYTHRDRPQQCCQRQQFGSLLTLFLMMRAPALQLPLSCQPPFSSIF